MKLKVVLATLLISTNVAAQTVKAEDIHVDPPIQTIPPGEDKITPLNVGEAAPYSGQLFDASTALRWGFWLQQWQTRYKLDVAQERNLCSAKLTYKDAVLQAELQRFKRVEEDLEARLLKVEELRTSLEQSVANPGFFSSPGFYYVLGIATAGVLLGTGVWVTTSVR